MANEGGTERRVYVLPNALLERLRAYQTRNGLPSEVEAVRRLLDTALQMKDTVQDILNKLKETYADEKDLRVLAKEILASHVLVKQVNFEENAVSFSISSDTMGRIDSEGRIFTAYNWDDWREVVPPRKPVVKAPSWEAPKGGDLDDEIPF